MRAATALRLSNRNHSRFLSEPWLECIRRLTHGAARSDHSALLNKLRKTLWRTEGIFLTLAEEPLAPIHQFPRQFTGANGHAPESSPASIDFNHRIAHLEPGGI